MKEIVELEFPGDLRYTEDHEWTLSEGEGIKIGISDYAQEQLGDIVFVELPQKGVHFDKGGEFGTVESVKAVSELYAPMSGEVTEVNQNALERPEILNEDPHKGGWLLKFMIVIGPLQNMSRHRTIKTK